jgi:hypothetical protein
MNLMVEGEDERRKRSCEKIATVFVKTRTPAQDVLKGYLRGWEFNRCWIHPVA